MKTLFVTMVLLCQLAVGFAMPAPAEVIPLGAPWNDASAWLEENESRDAVIADSERIAEINQAIRDGENAVMDLKKYSESDITNDFLFGLEELHGYGYVSAQDFDEIYAPDEQLGYDEYLDMLRNRNHQVEPTIQYGVVVKRGNMRSLPTDVCWGEEPGDVHYDMLQLTAIDPSEPVVVLRESLDGKFYYVQMRYYAGWLEKSHVALTDRDKWLSYVEPEDFYVVTTNRYIAENGARYQMGAKIKKSADEIVLPERDENGQLIEVGYAAPEENEDIHEGFLPYTEGNLTKMAFKHLGDEYGWGGLDDSVDCSSFVANVYRTVGVELPRDADLQANAMKQIDLEGLGHEERVEALNGAPVGSLLFSPTHVMLYLGEAEGVPVVIHSASSYYKDTEDGLKKVMAREVTVSTPFFKSRRNVPFIDVCDAIGWLR